MLQLDVCNPTEQAVIGKLKPWVTFIKVGWENPGGVIKSSSHSTGMLLL